MAKASDNPFPSLLLVEQAAAPATPASGQARLYRGTDNKLYIVDDAGVATEVGSGGSTIPAYSTYTPVLTGSTTNPTLGTGSIAEGRYLQLGKHVVGDVILKFGTSGVAAGSGIYRISLPVAARESAAGNYLGYARGSGFVYDDSTTTYQGIILNRITTTTVDLVSTSSGSKVQNSVPWTWAASDAIVLHLDYEAA